MRIGTRIFAGFVIVIALGFYFLVDWIAGDLTPRYRESTEEPLVDIAQTLAAFAAHSAVDGQLNIPLFRNTFRDTYERNFSADIFGFLKQSVDFRVYITNRDGFVVFDSDNGRDEGKDYSEWRDVKLTRRGEYGARTSRDIPGQPDASVMYVAAPIHVAGEFAGVLTVGKPTRNANKLIAAAEKKVTIAGVVVASAVMIVCLVISGMMTRPIHRLTDYARAITRGERPPLPELGSSEIASKTTYRPSLTSLKVRSLLFRVLQNF
jgi:two-component system sensor histidine kinase CreC